MTHQQKAQKAAKGYYDFLINNAFNPYLAWDAAMVCFKLEMQK